MNKKRIVYQSHSISCISIYDKQYFRVKMNACDLIYINDVTSNTLYFTKGSIPFAYEIAEVDKYIHFYYIDDIDVIRSKEINKILDE